MHKLRISLILALQSLTVFAQISLSTSPPLLPQAARTAGCTFEVSSTYPIYINGLNAHFSWQSKPVDIWIRPNGVSDTASINVSENHGWIKIIRGHTLPAFPLYPVDFDGKSIFIPANTPVGFYISEARNDRTNPNPVNSFTDSTLTINVSDSVSYGGNKPIPSNSSKFPGVIFYDSATTGNCNTFDNFVLDSIQTNSARLSWTPGPGNIGYKIEYGLKGFTPGTGTVIAGTYPTASETPPVTLTGLSNIHANYEIYLEEYCSNSQDTIRLSTPYVFKTPKLCRDPQNFRLIQIDPETVELRWDNTGSFTEAYIGYYGSSPSSIISGVDTIYGTTNSHILHINPHNNYFISLQIRCGNGNGISYTVGDLFLANTARRVPRDFSCSAAYKSVILNEDFDDTTSFSGEIKNGDGSWLFSNSITPSVNTGPSGPYSGSHYIYAEKSNLPVGVVDTIIMYSQAIDLSQATQHAELSFFLYAYGSGIDTLWVDISTNGTHGNYSNVHQFFEEYQSDTNQPWIPIGIPLNDYIGQQINLRFRYHRGVRPLGDIAIDELRLEVCIPDSCSAPDSLQVSALSHNSAYLQWADTSSATYIIEYGLVGSPRSSLMSLNSSANNLNLTGLLSGEEYRVFIRKVCGAGDSSVWAGPFFFSTICAVRYAPYFTNFEDFGIGQGSAIFNGPWGNCWGSNSNGPVWQVEKAAGTIQNSPGTGPYLDASFHPQAGGKYIYLETSNAPNGSAELISPSIDISTLTNPKLSFAYHMYGSSINKLLLYAENSTGSRTLLDSIVGQQQSTSLDSFRIKVISLNNLPDTIYRFIFEAYSGSTYAGDIAIDDILIDDSFACLKPLSVATTANITCDSIEVSWISRSGNSFIEYGLSGFNPGSGQRTAIVSSPYTLSNLNANTTYDIWVYDSCAGNISSGSLTSVTTANNPMPIANIVYSDTILNNQYILYLDASNSQLSDSFAWNFGNGQNSNSMLDTVYYLNNGNYTAHLYTSNACGSDSSSISILVNIGLKKWQLPLNWALYPNPAENSLTVAVENTSQQVFSIKLLDMSGRTIKTWERIFSEGLDQSKFDLSSISAGSYLILIQSPEAIMHIQLNVVKGVGN